MGNKLTTIEPLKSMTDKQFSEWYVKKLLLLKKIPFICSISTIEHLLLFLIKNTETSDDTPHNVFVKTWKHGDIIYTHPNMRDNTFNAKLFDHYQNHCQIQHCGDKFHCISNAYSACVRNPRYEYYNHISDYFNTCNVCGNNATNDIYRVFTSHVLNNYPRRRSVIAQPNGRAIFEEYDLNIESYFLIQAIKLELLKVKKSYDEQNLTQLRIQDIKTLINKNNRNKINSKNKCTELTCKIKNHRMKMRGEIECETSGRDLIKEITELIEEEKEIEKQISNVSLETEELEWELRVIERSNCVLLILNHFLEIASNVME